MDEYLPKYCTIGSSLIVENKREEFDESELCWMDGGLYNKDFTVLYKCESRKERFVVPKSVKRINDNAFYDCKDLSILELPNDLEFIGANVFCNNKLDTLFLPDSVRGIGQNLISDVNNIVISETNPYYFYEKGLLLNREKTVILECNKWNTVVVVPSTVKEIGDGSFEQCSNLISVEIPESVEKIKEFAFMECRNLKAINLPLNLEVLSESVFSGCRKLKDITIPCSVKSIEELAFWSCCRLRSVVIPRSVEVICSEAFLDCKGLISITILNPNIEVKTYAFNELSQNAVIYIPKNSKQLEKALRLSEYKGLIKELI